MGAQRTHPIAPWDVCLPCLRRRSHVTMADETPEADEQVRSRDLHHVLAVRITELRDKIPIRFHHGQMIRHDADPAGCKDPPVLCNAHHGHGKEVPSDVLWVSDDRVRSRRNKLGRVDVAFPLGDATVAAEHEDGTLSKNSGQSE